MQGISPSDPSCIRTSEELENKIIELGFLPLFAGEVPGFSVEEMTDPDAWWSGDPGTDPWAWRQIIARRGNVAYGKFFNKKAGFISRGFFPYFANYRRDGYDFDARYDDGLARFEDKELFELIDANAPVLSKELRTLGGYAYTGRYGKRTEGKKGFDASITRLQELGYVVICDFVYSADKYGNRRGWGVAAYSTPEKFMGEAFTERVYARSPEESRDRLLEHLHELLPAASEKELRRFLK